ncbi:site-specific DNA-methyltransferase [Vibrio parahaemolyticus]|nr:site-specific DNA-methyltransferase [Vibrio parahaemolyticus]MDN4725535.1 site-specific DNA-methyltransferase [Vibrio parahaemolyticus]
MAVPLQTIRSFNHTGTDDWANRLIFGDNLQALKSLTQDPSVAGKVKLIYIDPPFATKRDFKGSQDQKAYTDKVAGSEFIEFLRKRLILLRELLHPDGSIFVHLDSKKGHYIKLVLDEVFGEHNFVNEIIWHYRKWTTRIKAFQRNHDTIYWYAKQEANSNRKYDVIAYEEPSEGTLKRWKGKKQIATFDESGKRMAAETSEVSSGAPMSDVWKDISIINPAAVERVGYPTQKPEALIDRIIRSVTNEGDLVLDAFAGSGTTCAVAEKTGRRWIGIDAGKLSIYTVQKRLLNLKSEIGNKGKKLKPTFIVQNAGLYDFDSLKDLPWDDWRFFALSLFECDDSTHKVKGFSLDGKKGSHSVLVYDWKTHLGKTISEESIRDIHDIVGKSIGDKLYIIAPMMAFDFFQDYIDIDNVRYYALRIPYSMIHDIHKRDFEAISQAKSEGNVNSLHESHGFSFIISPEADLEVDKYIGKNEIEMISIRISKFISRSIISGDEGDFGFDSLSMMLVDYDYDGDTFVFDDFYLGDKLSKSDWKVSIPKNKVGERIMVILVDHHGNESSSIIDLDSI